LVTAGQLTLTRLRQHNPYLHFLTYNAVGGALWAITVPLLGYWLGGLIPNLDHYILLVVGAAVLLSLVPVALELRKLRSR